MRLLTGDTMISICIYCKESKECPYVLMKEQSGFASLDNKKKELYRVCEECKIIIVKRK